MRLVRLAFSPTGETKNATTLRASVRHLPSQNHVDLIHVSVNSLFCVQKVIRKEPIIRLNQSFKLICLAAIGVQANSFNKQVRSVAIRFIPECVVVTNGRANQVYVSSERTFRVFAFDLL